MTCDHNPLCHGFRWEILDEAALAQLVAWTLSGQAQHAEHILASVASITPKTWPEMRAGVIQKLRLPPDTGDETARWHRDGLVFQQIAWIAAHLSAPGSLASSMPHQIKAHKGFDAILVPLGAGNTANGGIIICEEKATINPRNQITSEVWPSVAEVETGARDSELTAELSLILRSYGVTNLDEILREAHWRNRKSYRVSITVSRTHESDARRRALFTGYDVHAQGDTSRRRAETLLCDDLRNWMDEFSEQVIEVLEADDDDV